MTLLPRLLLIFAGLVGAIGVAAAAAGSHGASRNLSAIAMIFLAHAPVFVAIALHGRGRAMTAAACALALGTLVFGADLGMREWLGHALFPGAAPLGGGGMMLGWLGLTWAGITARTRS